MPLGLFSSTSAAGVSVLRAVLSARARAWAVVPYAAKIGLGLMFALGDRSASSRVDVSSERMVVDSLGLVGVPAFTENSFGLTYRDSRRPLAAGEWPASAGGR